MAENTKMRGRQESTESVSSANTNDEYSSDDEKDSGMDDLNIIKTVGEQCSISSTSDSEIFFEKPKCSFTYLTLDGM